MPGRGTVGHVCAVLARGAVCEGANYKAADGGGGQATQRYGRHVLRRPVHHPAQRPLRPLRRHHVQRGLRLPDELFRRHALDGSQHLKRVVLPRVARLRPQRVDAVPDRHRPDLALHAEQDHLLQLVQDEDLDHRRRHPDDGGHLPLAARADRRRARHRDRLTRRSLFVRDQYRKYPVTVH